MNNDTQIPPIDVHKEVIDILNLQLDNPVSNARLLAIVQAERIAYWKSIGMSEQYMDVNEVWLELTGLLQFCRGISPWWDRTDASIEPDADGEKFLVDIMEIYEARYPEYLMHRKPLFESPWRDLHVEERAKLLPDFLAFKEHIGKINPYLDGISTAFNRIDTTKSIVKFVEMISDFMYEVHAVISESMVKHKKFFDLRVIQPFQLPHPHLVEHLLEYSLEGQSDIEKVIWLTNALSLFRESHPDLCEDKEVSDL